MPENVDFDFWEDLPTFVGPRISPSLRIRRLVEEQNRREECVRRLGMWGWAARWRNACEAADGNPQPTDPDVRATAAWDAFIDTMRAHGYRKTWRREDERWS